MIYDNLKKTGKLNIKNKNIVIILASTALGDTLAWIPYVEEFRKKHKCNVICSTTWNFLFENEYQDIKFIEPESTCYDIHAIYKIGWRLDDVESRIIPLQQTATEILGLEYKEIKPNIIIPKAPRNISGKYVCIAIQSTAQAKYWNLENGWQQVVDYLNSKGYEVVVIDKDLSFGNEEKWPMNYMPNNVINKTGQISLIDRIIDLKYADFFIGLPSGLSWLAWSVGTPVIMISGFSKPFCEFQSNMLRVQNESVCNGCFNDINNDFDKYDWATCPEYAGTDRQFECTKLIKYNDVLEKINIFIDEVKEEE
jgi:autotransporter strand-loop-strand O-heptosyltransferase